MCYFSGANWTNDGQVRSPRFQSDYVQFKLHPRLEADTISIGSLNLSLLLLKNDVRFPWIIMVPRRSNMREILDLSIHDQSQLFAEMQRVLLAMRSIFAPDKLNLGAIGNIVPQLHIHVIARFARDAAWPEPVWGFGEATPYSSGAIRETSTAIADYLKIELDQVF